MEVVLFRIHPRENVDGVEYENAFNHMLELVAEVPGFLGIEGFTGEDGSELAVARFDSPEAIARWRDHPVHIRTRERGRKEFFASYEIIIATTWKQYGWNAADGQIRVTEDLRNQETLSREPTGESVPADSCPSSPPGSSPTSATPRQTPAR